MKYDPKVSIVQLQGYVYLICAGLLKVQGSQIL